MNKREKRDRREQRKRREKRKKLAKMAMKNAKKVRKKTTKVKRRRDKVYTALGLDGGVINPCMESSVEAASSVATAIRCFRSFAGLTPMAICE